MKIKLTALTLALLSATSFSLFAAQELTPERAAELQPTKRITIRGNFIRLGEAADAVSKVADKQGAAYFYIQDIAELQNGSTWQVTADIYNKDAKEKGENEKYREFDGVLEYPKHKALSVEPYDTVTVRGYFATQPDVNMAIAKAAKLKDAYAFYIVRQNDINSHSSNQEITAFIFKKDARVRQLQKENVIPYDSDAGRQAVAEGGEAAAQVEVPGRESPTTFSGRVGFFSETRDSAAGLSRYTVTLPDGTKIEELNNATAAKMTPFKSINFRGYFVTGTDISYAAAKKAAAEGAKYYHITRQYDDKGTGNFTVYVELFK